MPIVWCSISAHGFGHAAQIIPILNALGEAVENVHVVLRTCVSSSIFQEYLQVSWERQPVPQDIGCIQRGPLDVDVKETWLAYQAFHANWTQRVRQEAQAMSAAKADLVLSNISYLAIASASYAGCPVVAIASLSWDRVLEEFIQESMTDHWAIYKTIQTEYAKANHLIRLHPGIDMPVFPLITDTGPSFPLSRSSPENVRTILGIPGEERLVLLAFGGVPLTSLPLKHMEACQGYHFLVAGFSVDASGSRVHRVEDLKLPFGEILRQADVVMTKPGYATIVTAVHYNIPLVYVRRNFVDEQPLVDYVHQYGRGVELAREDFESGAWEKALHASLSVSWSPKSSPQPEHGAAVSLLKSFLHT